MPYTTNSNLRGPSERVDRKKEVGGSHDGNAIQKKGSSDCQSSAVSIRQKLAITPTISQNSKRGCCIYRVPKLLRKEEAYTPVLVSIGPFHHGNERLVPMEPHKDMYLRSFINESGKRGVSRNTYLKIIKDKESQIRECYAEPTGMPSEEFIQMILTDSVFVIELFRTRKFVAPFTEGEVLHDLQLAENQVPFFILKDLYSAAFEPADQNTSFTRLACNFFEFEIKPISDEAASSCCHLLDLLRSLRLPSSSSVSNRLGSHEAANPLPHTATRLCESKLKFDAKDSKKYGLLDIDFDQKSQKLSIPVLEVKAGTESLFQNLIAFEQCHYLSDCYIFHYQIFMNRLINTVEDVQLLSKAGIIHEQFSSDKKVLDLFKSLGTNVSWDSSRYSYAKIANQLNEHCNKS